MRKSRLFRSHDVTVRDCNPSWVTSQSRSAQRLLQQREAVGIKTLRGLEHRRVRRRERAWCRPLVENGVVGHVALRGSATPAFEHRADEMHVMTGGDRGYGLDRGLTARQLMRRHLLET